LQAGEAGGLAKFPLAGEPGVEITRGPGRKIHQLLCEVKPRIEVEQSTEV